MRRVSGYTRILPIDRPSVSGSLWADSLLNREFVGSGRSGIALQIIFRESTMESHNKIKKIVWTVFLQHFNLSFDRNDLDPQDIWSPGAGNGK